MSLCFSVSEEAGSPFQLLTQAGDTTSACFVGEAATWTTKCEAIMKINCWPTLCQLWMQNRRLQTTSHHCWCQPSAFVTFWRWTRSPKVLHGLLHPQGTAVDTVYNLTSGLMLPTQQHAKTGHWIIPQSWAAVNLSIACGPFNVGLLKATATSIRSIAEMHR